MNVYFFITVTKPIKRKNNYYLFAKIFKIPAHVSSLKLFVTMLSWNYVYFINRLQFREQFESPNKLVFNEKPFKLLL